MGMGNYRFEEKKAMQKKQTHPLWRGLGCLMIVLVPIMSYAAAYLTTTLFIIPRYFLLIPPEILATIRLPDWLFAFLPILASALQRILNTPYLILILLVTLVYIVIFSGIMSFLYAFVYRIANPSKRGPFDAPPPKAKIKKYTR